MAKKGASLPWFYKLWLLPVWMMLSLSSLAVKIFPGRMLIGLLGPSSGVDPWVLLVTSRQVEIAGRIEGVVALAARYTPWEVKCLAQTLTARVVLSLYRVPHSTFIGVSRNQDSQKMEAHAWVVAGPVTVVGGDSFGHFAVVASFHHTVKRQGQ